MPFRRPGNRLHHLFQALERGLLDGGFDEGVGELELGFLRGFEARFEPVPKGRDRPPGEPSIRTDSPHGQPGGLSLP
ncbi:hypothetical protein P4B35_22975 [Pontiellaceae bacterium B12227]|nr:hypothetical protein [Pontiellaceae bacterium B12227]